MTRQEAIKVLAVLRAAYPNSYKNMDVETANATVNIWSTQFINMPYEIVAIAIQKLISTNVFPPAIPEVKDKIREIYYEAEEMLRAHKQATEGIKLYDDDDDPLIIGEPLDDKSLAIAQLIVKHCDGLRYKEKLEPTIQELINVQGIGLSSTNSDTLKLNQRSE